MTSCNSNDLGKIIFKLITLIENNSWNEVKKFWLVDVCRKNANRKIYCFGSVFEFFGKYLQDIQLYYENSCNSLDCGNGRFKEGRYIELYKCDNQFFIELCRRHFFCRKCAKFYKNESYFNNNPPFLIVDTNSTQQIFVQDVPKNINISGKQYKFLFCNYKSSNIHFKSIFYLNNSYFVIDDLNNREIKEEIPPKKIDTCFYYLE